MAERELPLFPLNLVLFPGMRLPLHIFEERYKLMIGTCMVTDHSFGVVMIEQGRDTDTKVEFRDIGTTAQIVELERLPEGRMNVVAVGVDRFRIIERLPGQPYHLGRVEPFPDRREAVSDGLVERLTQHFRRYLLARGVASERLASLSLPDDPLALSYAIGATLRLPTHLRQGLLEEPSLAARLRRELAHLQWLSGGPTEANAKSFSAN